MLNVSDDDIIAELTAGGARVEDYLLIGQEICSLDLNRRLISLLIEEVEGDDGNEMYDAILSFLQRHGAKSYASREDFKTRENNK